MKKIFFLALLISVCTINPVRAVEPGTMSFQKSEAGLVKQQLQDAKETAIETRQVNRQKQCDLIESRINFRLNQYEQNRNRHYTVFQGVRKRIEALITKFENRGCDVSVSKSNLETFDTLIADFAASFREFTTSMQATRENRCGESEGKFASSAQEARGKSLNLRQKSQAVHAYFKNTIKPELAQQVKRCQPSPEPSASPIVEGNQ